MNRRILPFLAIGATLALGALGVGWTQRDRITAVWWDLRARDPLSPAQLEQLSACGQQPEWPVLYRAILQDLQTDCGEDHLVSALATQVAEHPLRREWLRTHLSTPGDFQGSRLRIAAAFLEAGVEDPELLWIAGDPANPADRLDWWSARLSGIESGWADPGLQLQISQWRIRYDADRTEEDVRRLWWGVAHPTSPRLDTRATLLDTVGVELSRIKTRREKGLPINDLPRAWLPLLQERIHDCDEVGSSRCLVFLLDLLALGDAEGGLDPLTAPDVEIEATPFRPLWELRFDGDRRLIAAAEDELAQWRARARPEGLLRLVADPSVPPDPSGVRDSGDPIATLRRRAGSPWTAAATAIFLAQGAPVVVGETDGWVDLTIGQERVLLGGCGARTTPPLDAEDEPRPVTPFPPEAVLGRAFAEAADSEARAGRRVHALQLAALAERLDPTLADVAQAVDRALPPDMSAEANQGRRAGALLGWPSPAHAPAEPPRGLPRAGCPAAPTAP